MSIRHRLNWSLASILIATTFVHSAYAQQKPSDAPPSNKDKPEAGDDAARILFDAGAKAYAAGLYADAVTAFREAHKLSPDRPTVLFSLAQAERREYTVKQDPALVEAAIAHFRRYLEIVTEGGRRGDAVVALGELEALRAGAEAPAAKAARIFITTETPGAVIYVDGKKYDQVPVIEETSPGKHVIKIEARGFVEETREIVAVEGTIFPLEINLGEKPSFLTINAPPGATISVDGRNHGDAPLAGPIDLLSGSHRVIVTRRGYVPYDKPYSVDRASSNTLTVTLPPTTQRKLTYVLFGASMTGFSVGTALIIASIAKDAEAADILDKAKKENIDRGTLEKYINAYDVRNALILSTSAMELVAVGLGVASAATFVFDSSSRVNATPGRNEARFSVAPLTGGGFVSMGLRF